MNSQKIISLLENPHLLQDVELNELNEIISVYPFFNPARILLTKKMQQVQHLLLKKEIRKTSISVPNRKYIYEFLYKKNIHKTIIASTEKDIGAPVEVQEKDTPSSFTAPVEIKSEVQPKSSFEKPIDFKIIAKENPKEMDLLEKQIIGQTIEHVLAQEIANTKDIIDSKEQNKPIDVTDSQKFSDWLTILDQDRLKNWRKKELEDQSKYNTSKESDIIDSFLQKDVKVISEKSENIEYTPSNLARLSIVDDEDFITETLAKIYVDQGNLPKALTAYKKLLLKYPEKKTYFAAQIEKIEKDLKLK